LPLPGALLIIDKAFKITKKCYAHYDSISFTPLMGYDFHFYSPEAIEYFQFLPETENKKFKIC